MTKSLASLNKNVGLKHMKNKKKPKKKKHASLKRINKHNQNAKRLKREKMMRHPLDETFLPSEQTLNRNKESSFQGQKPSRKMAKVLNMIQSVKEAEQEQTEKESSPSGVQIDETTGERISSDQSSQHDHQHDAQDPAQQEQTSRGIDSLIGKDYDSLSRKEKQKIRRKMKKEEAKMRKLDKSLKRMYRKDKNLEIDHDFSAVGEDHVEFGEEAIEPPKKAEFSKKKAKMATRRIPNMSDEQLKRYKLRQMAIQRNAELQTQKAKMLYSAKKKRESMSEYVEFDNWDE